MGDEGFRRIAVIGTSGAGKTTLARRLSAALDLPHLELDSIFHQAGWEPLPDDEFRRQVAAFCAGDRWVTCGKYAVVRDLLFARADAIVCLDHGRLRQALRVYGRTLRRVVSRRPLWNGNRERWSGLWPFGPADQVMARWTWENIPRVRRLFDQLEAHPPPGAVVIRLRGWHQIDAFLRSMQEAGSA
jgi:adenylate kinase family enzyme